jgi:hypothetical protein
MNLRCLSVRQCISVEKRLNKLAPQTVRSVPEAATTVLCTPDDGRDEKPETCRVI